MKLHRETVYYCNLGLNLRRKNTLMGSREMLDFFVPVDVGKVWTEPR